MTMRSTTRKLAYRLSGIKPSPLRQGQDQSFIFVHINKTAGTSVGNAIGLPVKDHLTAMEIIERVGKVAWDNAFKFSLVRNPWDRVVSLYEYRRKKNKTQIATRGITFSDWVELVFGDNPDPFYCNNPKSFQPQVEWLKDDEEKFSIDFVGKFETIAQDFEYIRNEIGIDAVLPHLNASDRGGYQAYYNQYTRDVVAHRFGEDNEMFGYRFQPTNKEGG
jgi:hypothetical protein